MARSSLDVRPRVLGGADVGTAHDLDERHAGPVVVDERVLGAVDAPAAAEVRRLAGVLFHVGALDADARAVGQLEPAVDVDRPVVLGDLVVLRHVRVEVVLPVEDRRLDRAVQRLPERIASSTACRLSTGSEPGSPRHTGQMLRVGLVAELVRAAAEHLVCVASSTCTSSPITELPARLRISALIGDRSGPSHALRARRRRGTWSPRRAPGPAPGRRPAARRRRRRTGTRHRRVPGEVRRDRAHVVQVHRQRIGGLRAELERGGRRGRRRAAGRTARTRREVAGDERAHLLRLAVVRVVVAGRQRVGAEHDAPLHLGAEAGGARRRVHRGRRRRASTRRP